MRRLYCPGNYDRPRPTQAAPPCRRPDSCRRKPPLPPLPPPPRINPASIIDMATLTGACVVALGEHHAGLFGNNSNLQHQLEKAAQTSGELLWPLPSGPDYLEQMRCKIADLKNTNG